MARGWISLGWRLARKALCIAFLCGCSTSEKKFSYLGEAEFGDYVDTELTIDSPHVDQPVSEKVTFAGKPRLLSDRSHDTIRDLTLGEAIHLALINNRIVRTRGDFQSPGNSLYSNPDGVASVYDPAIRETGVLFGARGVESALSQFDTQWTTSMLWNTNDQIQNNPISSGGIPAGNVLQQDTANFSTGLTKNFGYGGSASVTQSWNYTQSNQQFQLFPSVYTGSLQFNYIQPLWAGAGAEFTRIAGPLNTNVQGLSGVNQGVIIARINTDMTLADFEAQVRNMVKDVEDVYWELYLAYRNWHSLVVARNNALQTWRVVKAKADSDYTGGGAAEEAQAREAFFDAKARAQAALAGPISRTSTSGDQGLYGVELQLRRLCGLSINDGTRIRPVDEPMIAEFTPDWHSSLAEALTRREELRRQKWNIKSLELQLRAANSLANPQLNFVTSYQLNGFGNNLFGQDGPEGSDGADLQSAYRTLFRGDQAGWGVGFQFSMPLGMRNALTQVRNTELRLAKARDVLATQELEVSHELAAAVQQIDYWYHALKTNYNRLQAADENYRALEAEYQADRKSLDFLLQGLNRYVVAETSFYRSLVEYNKAITEVHYRKGTLLEINNIHLAEGTWTPEAYREAIRRAWARSYALDPLARDPVHTEPEGFVAGPGQPTLEFYEIDKPEPLPLPAEPAAASGPALSQEE
jgi:hypothetical protein